MSDPENQSEGASPPAEATLPAQDNERVSRLMAEIMEPALQKAVAQAAAQAPEMEVISAIANAYAALLITSRQVCRRLPARSCRPYRFIKRNRQQMEK